MTQLAPNLFDRRFQDLVEIGRARLRPLAPEWTDHNAHDPGITLMELLAWVAEAQLYSVSRLRRDERASYAALLGLETTGTRSARGLIWPDHLDPDCAGCDLREKSRHFRRGRRARDGVGERRHSGRRTRCCGHRAVSSDSKHDTRTAAPQTTRR